MNKKELKEYLKKHLEIKVDMSYNNDSVDANLYLEGEKISSGHGSKYPSGDTGPF